MLSMTLRRLRVGSRAATLAGLAVLPPPRSAPPRSRLKDVVTLQGFRPSPLIGYGLVVGLNKTGDKRQTIFSTQSLANMLVALRRRTCRPIRSRSRTSPRCSSRPSSSPYQRTGARLDVIASSIGDARSLQGGTLLPTSLRGPDGEMVALAQGPLSIGGFGGGGGGTSVVGESPDRRPHSRRRDRRRPAPELAMPSTGTLTFALARAGLRHGVPRGAGDQHAISAAWRRAPSIPAA